MLAFLLTTRCFDLKNPERNAWKSRRLAQPRHSSLGVGSPRAGARRWRRLSGVPTLCLRLKTWMGVASPRRRVRTADGTQKKPGPRTHKSKMAAGVGQCPLCAKYRTLDWKSRNVREAAKAVVCLLRSERKSSFARLKSRSVNGNMAGISDFRPASPSSRSGPASKLLLCRRFPKPLRLQREAHRGGDSRRSGLSTVSARKALWPNVVDRAQTLLQSALRCQLRMPEATGAFFGDRPQSCQDCFHWPSHRIW